MGSDRSHEYSGPCACGAGKFEIDYCTPDHGWPVATREWYEPRIVCASCASKYELRQYGRKFHLVERSEIQGKEALRQELKAAVAALEAAAKAKGIDKEMAELLDAQKSMAATHRVLTRSGLSYESLPTLRKRWPGGIAWVERNFSGYSVAKVLKAIGKSSEPLEKQANAVDALRSKVDEDPKPIGDPIYVATDDA